MTNAAPPISKYMSTSPHTIGKDQTIAKAAEVMRTHKIRHLPVLEGGAIVGLLSERDIALIETLKDVDPTRVSVEEAMSGNAYVVEANTSLREVAGNMAEHKYGSAVVMQNNKVVGMFTTVDACRVLTQVLTDN